MVSDFVTVSVEEYKALRAAKDGLSKINSILSSKGNADTQINVDELIESIRFMNEELARISRTYAC